MQNDVSISKKPPIGLVPRYIWLSRRLYEIKCAIERYTLCNYEIPIEWIKEYNDLVSNMTASFNDTLD